MRLRSTIIGCATCLALLGAFGCNDSAAPAAVPDATRPELSLGSGGTNVVLVRANAGIIKLHSDFNGFKSKLSTEDTTDIVVNNNSMVPGGTSGWHSHPGITLVAIKSGALTMYDADDPLCQATIYSAGQVFVEEGGDAHIARNEGSVGAVWYTTYIVPKGAGTRVDEPVPGNCPF